jgi:hypothetical protein
MYSENKLGFSKKCALLETSIFWNVVPYNLVEILVSAYLKSHFRIINLHYFNASC